MLKYVLYKRSPLTSHTTIRDPTTMCPCIFVSSHWIFCSAVLWDLQGDAEALCQIMQRGMTRCTAPTLLVTLSCCPFHVFSRTAAQQVMREQALQRNRLGSCLSTKRENGRLLPPGFLNV